VTQLQPIILTLELKLLHLKQEQGQYQAKVFAPTLRNLKQHWRTKSI
jgi:hypothetical protein